MDGSAMVDDGQRETRWPKWPEAQTVVHAMSNGSIRIHVCIGIIVIDVPSQLCCLLVLWFRFVCQCYS
eukprot:COSAG01_NODE_5452_length_4256_cov_3.523454_4_plen_68_part_00